MSRQNESVDRARRATLAFLHAIGLTTAVHADAKPDSCNPGTARIICNDTAAFEDLPRVALQRMQ